MDEKQAMIASLINNLIRDEWEAIEGYNGVIATLADSEGDDIDGIISNLEDIRDEEYVHVGQLESCLSVLRGDPVEQINDGSEEGFEKLELPEEDDEDDEEIEEELTEDWLIRAVIRVFLDPESNKFNSDVKKLDNLCRAHRVEGHLASSNMYVIKPVADTRPGLKQVGKDIMWYIDRNIDSFVRYSNDSVFSEAFTKDVDAETESLKESDGERFDWDITDEVDREYERITKKFPNITDDELEDRLYSSIANILSGWQMEDKGKTIDNIINAVMNEKRRAISTEDVSTEEMKNVICSMINEYDASEEEVYDELSSATPDVSRDMVHRLYQMCSGNKEEPQQETSFDDFWNELEDTEED